MALLDDSSDVVIDAVRAALASTHDNKQRVAATMRAFYSYVANAEGAFRLVFESDLTNEPLVKERLDRVTTQCAALIAEVIEEDTQLPSIQSHLLAVSLVGMGQVSARFWLNSPGDIGQDEAAALVAGLAWRGIRGYPEQMTPHQVGADQKPWRSRSAYKTRHAN
ncbi:MAG: TetR/AcrR family transcriptional regulator [Marmoricola sp.]